MWKPTSVYYSTLNFLLVIKIESAHAMIESTVQFMIQETEVSKYWAKLLLLDISIVMLYSRDEDDTEKEGKKQPPM